MTFSGVGLGVPVALGDGHGNGPGGAGPPGQLAKQNGASGQGNSQGQGNGHGQGHGHGNGAASGAAQTAAPVLHPAHDQGNGNGQPGHGASHGGRHSAAASPVTGNGPNGGGPPGQLKKQNGSRSTAATGPRAAAAAVSNGAGSSQGNSPTSSASAASGSGSSTSSQAGHSNSHGLHARSRTGATRIPPPVTTVTQATARQTSASHGGRSPTTAATDGAGGIGPLAITSAGTTGSLTASGTGRTGGSGPITGALAPGTASIGTRAAATRHATRSTHSDVDITIRQILPPLLAAPAGTIIHVISVIPTGVWIALAVALALAFGAGAAAVRSRHQVRLQATEVAAVTAAALTDPLTGVLNRRGFLEAGERELDRARRYGHPLALAFVDIRGLKAVNDTEGHLAGDKLLKRVTMLLRESARTHDLVGRIGGDELAVLLAEQSADGAEAMTQRVRAQIPAYRASLGLVTGWDVTIGTATFPEDGDDLEQLLDAADRRLYLQRGIDLAK